MERIAIHSCKTGLVTVRQRTAEEQAQVDAEREANAQRQRAITAREKLERATGLTIEQIKAELSR